MKEVKQMCNSVETIFEMNQVWLFVAGMDPDQTKQLLEHLGHVGSADERVRTHRQTVGNVGCYSKSDLLISDIQGFVSDCVSEGINNDHLYENVCLQDFYINGYTIRDVEQFLFCSDMSKVKSVYLWTRYIEAATMTSITGQFLQCCALQKLYLNDWCSSLIPVSTVEILVDNNCGSLTILYLNTSIRVTDKLVTGICTGIGKSLMAIGLLKVKLTHEQNIQILHSLSNAPAIKGLLLKELQCTDHPNKCGAKIDCSAMSQLQKLTLWGSMYVDNLPYFPHNVEKVKLRYVTLSVTSLRVFSRGLSQIKRKVTVELYGIAFTETRGDCGDLEEYLRRCPGLKLTKCEYCDSDNTWSVDFHTSSK